MMKCRRHRRRRSESVLRWLVTLSFVVVATVKTVVTEAEAAERTGVDGGRPPPPPPPLPWNKDTASSSSSSSSGLSTLSSTSSSSSSSSSANDDSTTKHLLRIARDAASFSASFSASSSYAANAFRDLEFKESGDNDVINGGGDASSVSKSNETNVIATPGNDVIAEERFFFDGEVRFPFMFTTSAAYVVAKMKFYATFSIYFKLKTTQSTGLIFFSGLGSDKDFLAVELYSGHLRYVFDVGSGTRLIEDRLPVSLSDNQWHDVTILRPSINQHLLRVDAMVSSDSLPDSRSVHYDLPDDDLYVGGLPRQFFGRLPRQVKSHEGFQGCLASVHLDGLKWTLAASSSAASASAASASAASASAAAAAVESRLEVIPNEHRSSIIDGCQGPTAECSATSCDNGGICRQQWNSVTCDCEMTSFTGEKCAQDGISYVFGLVGGGGLISFIDHVSVDRRSDRLAFGFLTTQRNCVLLRLASATSNDFIEVQLIDARLTVFYNLGKTTMRLSHVVVFDVNNNQNQRQQMHQMQQQQVELDDGRLHVVRFTRSGPNATLQIDAQPMQTMIPTGRQLTTFNQMGITYIGGRKDSTGRLVKSFQGIIAGLMVNGLSLLELASGGDGRVRLEGEVELSVTPLKILQQQQQQQRLRTETLLQRRSSVDEIVEPTNPSTTQLLSLLPNSTSSHLRLDQEKSESQEEQQEKVDEEEEEEEEEYVEEEEDVEEEEEEFSYYDCVDIRSEGNPEEKEECRKEVHAAGRSDDIVILSSENIARISSQYDSSTDDNAATTTAAAAATAASSSFLSSISLPPHSPPPPSLVPTGRRQPGSFRLNNESPCASSSSSSDDDDDCEEEDEISSSGHHQLSILSSSSSSSLSPVPRPYGRGQVLRRLKDASGTDRSSGQTPVTVRQNIATHHHQQQQRAQSPVVVVARRTPDWIPPRGSTTRSTSNVHSNNEDDEDEDDEADQSIRRRRPRLTPPPRVSGGRVMTTTTTTTRMMTSMMTSVGGGGSRGRKKTSHLDAAKHDGGAASTLDTDESTSSSSSVIISSSASSSSALGMNIGLIVGIASGLILLVIVLAFAVFKYLTSSSSSSRLQREVHASYKLDDDDEEGLEKKYNCFEAYSQQQQQQPPSKTKLVIIGQQKTTSSSPSPLSANPPTTTTTKKKIKEWYV